MTLNKLSEKFKKRLIEGRVAFSRFACKDENEYNIVPLKVNVATQLTIIRIFCAPFFLISVFYGYHKAALTLFVFAALSDALDGAVARAFNQKTWLGSFLDPFADKLFLIAAFISLTFFNNSFYKIPVWLTIIVFSRDILIMTGCMFFEITKLNLSYKPLRISKLTTFFQISTVSGGVICNAFSQMQSSVLFNHIMNTVNILTLLLTLISGVMYFKIGLVLLSEVNTNRDMKNANNQKSQRR